MPVSVPTFIKQAWAAVGTKFTIPDNANPTTGRAGWDQGFSPINLTPVAAGGIPPFGQDMNGVLYDITSAIQYIQAGRSFPYNQDFADAVGGYGKGSLVSLESDLSVIYKSKIDNNLTPPPSVNWEVSGDVAQATESVAGVAKVGTLAEVKSGLSDQVFVTPKKLADSLELPLGQGQTWKTVARSIGVSYTNTSGRAIALSIYTVTNSEFASSAELKILVNGITVARWDLLPQISSSDNCALVVIPSGSTYQYTVTSYLSSNIFVQELRA